MLNEPDGRSLPVMVVIPARGGSKGVPGKALAELDGKPLVGHTVAYARTIAGVDKVVVTTDDPFIRETAIAYGAEAPFLRPAEMAGDYSPMEQVMRHTLEWYERVDGFVPRVLVRLYCTNPFRRPGLVDIAIRWGLERSMLIGVRSVALMRCSLEDLRFTGTVQPVVPEAEKYQGTKVFTNSGNFSVHFPGRDLCLEQGKLAPFLTSGSIVLHPVEAIDIDEPCDLELARDLAAAGLHQLPALGWDKESFRCLEFHPLNLAPNVYPPYAVSCWNADEATI
jgi:N-acylneuraminate cytidylyltransferase